MVNILMYCLGNMLYEVIMNRIFQIVGLSPDLEHKAFLASFPGSPHWVGPGNEAKAFPAFQTRTLCCVFIYLGSCGHDH